VLLFVRELTGSFATAGLVTGALGVGTAVGAPLAARLVDRRGTRVLMLLALSHAVALLAIWLLGSSDAPSAALAAAALCAGAAFPPSGSVLRSRWHELVSHPDLVQTAYAFDSVMIEVSFVTGPLITAVIVAVSGAEVALAVSAVLVILGTAVFLARLPDSGVAADEHHPPLGLLGPLNQPAIRLIALTTFPVGFCIGTVEVAVPAFSQEEGSAALAGILLAVWSAASGIGGLVFGARRPTRSLAETFVVIAVVFPLACLPLAGASNPVVMGVLMALAGLPIAPLIASRNELVSHLAPRGSATESFTWLLTALLAGAAAGSAVAGALVDSQGWQAAVLVGSGVAGVGAMIAVTLRKTLRPSLSG
jgi:MFS family permease